MALTGIGSSIAASALAQQNMQNQLDVLSRQLGTGQKAAVYSDLGSQAGLTVGLDSQLSALTGYANTSTTITTTLSLWTLATLRFMFPNVLVEPPSSKCRPRNTPA